jgi:hypothetical protein
MPSKSVRKSLPIKKSSVPRAADERFGTLF